MGQPYGRVFNFSAGPGTLPLPVLEQVRDEALNWQGSGMSVMEMSHRGKHFMKIAEEAEADLRALMAIPNGYKVMFLQGGASLQFTMVPMNLLSKGGSADIAVTGEWGKKALSALKIEGGANVVFDDKAGNYAHAPKFSNLSFSEGGEYFHFTSNETIQGVDYLSDPEIPGKTVVCDMSSNILSRPVDVSKYSLIYAGAQKNCGPAGATIVIMHESLLGRIPDGLPPMLDYKIQSENGWMYNTPPCWSVYVCGLVFKHLLANGGLEAVAKQNERKAARLYEAIDGSGGFYIGHADRACRSLMNIPFRLASDSLTDAFISEATKGGLLELKGHRSVGGCRASLYNAFPYDGVIALTDFMANFQKRNCS